MKRRLPKSSPDIQKGYLPLKKLLETAQDRVGY